MTDIDLPVTHIAPVGLGGSSGMVPDEMGTRCNLCCDTPSQRRVPQCLQVSTDVGSTGGNVRLSP